MPATVEGRKLSAEVTDLLNQIQAKKPAGELLADVKLSTIADSQRRIAEASAFLEASQDEEYQALQDGPSGIDFKPFPPGAYPYTMPPGNKPSRAVDKLGRFNQIRNKYGLGPVEKVPEKVGVLEQLGEEIDKENLPLVGGVFTAVNLWNVQNAASRAEKGRATADDWDKLAGFMEQSVADARERTFSGGVARIAAGSVPFWIDFFASGGAAAVVKKGGKEAGERAVKKTLSSVLSGAATKVAQTAGTTALRLPVFSHRVAAEAFRRTTPQFATVLPREKNAPVEFVVLNPGEGKLEAAKNAIGDVYIEVFSEQTGEIVGLIGGQARRLAGMKPARVGAREILRNFGFHGMVGEVAEERIGELLRESATRLGALDLPQEVPSAKQLAQEAIAFSIPAAGGALLGRAIGERPTPEQIKAFIETYPEESKKIAAIEGTVSRKKMADAAGPVIAREAVGRMNRSMFRDMVREGLGGQVRPKTQGPDTQKPSGAEKPAEPSPSDVRPEYVFRGEDKATAEQVKALLPAGLQAKVKIVKKGNKNYKQADGGQVAARIGVEQMAQSVLLQQEGKPHLANPAIAEPGRQMVRGTDEIDALAGVPERVRDETVKQAADQRVQADYAGERANLLETARAGGQLNPVDTVVAKTIVGREAFEAAMSGDLEKVEAAIDLVQAYRRTGTEQAMAFRQRHDPVETPAQRRKRVITEHLMTPSPLDEARLQKLLEQGDTGEAQKIKNKWAKQYGKVIRYLQRIGIDLRNIDWDTLDDVSAQKILNQLNAAKSSRWEVAQEWFRNAILGPSSQAANIISNLAFTGLYFGVQRPLEMAFAAGNRAFGGKLPTGATFGEVPYAAAGMMRSIGHGIINFYKSWDTETPILELELRGTNVSKLEGRNIAIIGEKGRVIRHQQRLLLAFDELQKTIIANIDVGAQAYRIAKEDGLHGPELQARIQQLTTDHSSPAWERALETARNLTFQTGGETTRSLVQMRERHPWSFFLFPFIATPVNIMKEGAKRAPLLSELSLSHKIYKAARTGDWSDVPPQAVNVGLAWSAVIAVMATNDPEDPWITGSLSELKYDTRQQAYRTHPPQSFKVGNTWYSYARIEPFATYFSIIADLSDALQKNRPLDALVAPFSSFVASMNNKTFIKTVGDVVDMTDRGLDFNQLASWSSTFASGWIPNIIRTVSRETSHEVPERRIWGEGADKLHHWWRRLMQKSEVPQLLGFFDDTPKIDFWGRPVRRSLSETPPRTDYWYRILSPVRRKEEDIALGDRILMNWNDNHPDDERTKTPPRPYFTGERFPKGKRWMSDGEYAQFLTLRGRLADYKVRRFPWKDIQNPSDVDMKRFDAMIESSHESAKNALLREWSENPMAEHDPNLVDGLLERLSGNPFTGGP